MKVAWFQGDCRTTWPSQPYRSMDDIIASVDNPDGFEADVLELVLVPDDTDFGSFYGDDWDDAPADCNAGPPYERTLPAGSVVLTLKLGDSIEITLPQGV